MTSTPNVPGFTSGTPHPRSQHSGELPHREHVKHGIEVRILTVYVDKQESSGTVGMFSLPAAFVLAESGPCTYLPTFAYDRHPQP